MAAGQITKKSKKQGGVAFSKRECQCMQHAMEGKNVQQIAENLKITTKSTCFYLTNIKRKIEVLID
jgi:DNA-binding CsgD family transcriptional regulator